jgi:hypothetical protein
MIIDREGKEKVERASNENRRQDSRTDQKTPLLHQTTLHHYHTEPTLARFIGIIFEE